MRRLKFAPDIPMTRGTTWGAPRACSWIPRSLRQLGCHGAQGYLFAGLLPGEAFAAFLADEALAVAVA